MLMNGDSARFKPIGEFVGLIITTLDFVKFNVNLLATIHLLPDEILQRILHCISGLKCYSVKSSRYQQQTV